MSTFNYAPEVKQIAKKLIAEYHPDLIRCRVRIEYVFCDKEVKSKGKTVFGKCELWSGMKAWMSPEPEDMAEFDPLTFVCRYCWKWSTDAEYGYVDVGSERYSYCPGCVSVVNKKDIKANRVIGDLAEKAKRADGKEELGPPENLAFFVVTIYKGPWCRMRDETRVGVIDHQLCHMHAEYDKHGDVKLACKDHDLEDFNDVAERHGPNYRSDIIKFDQALNRHKSQMEMRMTQDGNTASLMIPNDF